MMKLKNFISISLLMILFLTLISCNLEQKPVVDQVSNFTEQAMNESLINSSGQDSSGCTANWTCISSTDKAYRDEKCDFTQRTKCDHGCVNGVCQAPAICEAGFKCKNAYEKGYQQ